MTCLQAPQPNGALPHERQESLYTPLLPGNGTEQLGQLRRHGNGTAVRLGGASLLPKPADAEAPPDAASANQEPATTLGSCFDPNASLQAGPDTLAALSESAAAPQQAGHQGHADAVCTQHAGYRAAGAPHVPQPPAEAAVPRAEPHDTGQAAIKQQQASVAAAQQPQSHQQAQQQQQCPNNQEGQQQQQCPHHQEGQQQAHLYIETPAGAAAEASGSEQPTAAAPSEAEERSQPAGPGPGSEAQTATTTAGYVSGAYTQREAFLQGLEAAGEMSFEYVRNDGQRHSSMW